ncbi:cohesin domain-containing protein [Cohnella sp. GbtcB17]|uniref:cohesin domain-containing protein n=1 Tax=Cohnella sp. GbtcB17 TaxID=2824762 RepID=UPI001C301E72|nr:cohesin domain-containing protein [Cohnella sp. GbtcB17]
MMTLVMAFSMLPFAGAAAAADGGTPSATIYVAPTGNDDTGNGSQAKPYKTIGKAKAVVRTMPKTGGDIVVQIADGFYSLDETLVFTKEDSGSATSTIRYEAAPGAQPVVSAGQMLEKGVWTEAVGLTQTNGLKAYKTTLNRSDKLRAIYVNDKRANMTTSAQIASGNRTVTGTPTVSFTSADNPWAWQNGSNIRGGIVFDASVGLTTDTKNPQNIEAESMGGSTARWARPFVTFASIEQAPAASGKPGGVMLRFQMPYGAISQSLGNNTQYNPGNNQVIRNAFEFLNKRGDFYFDQAESTLYYIPLEGEDINTAEVVIPRLETVVDIRGIPVGDRLNPIAGSDDGRVKNITFNGLKFAHTDYKLFELTGTYTYSDGTGPVTTSSRGYASVQGSIVNKVYFPSSINWHETFYRGYDIPPAAVMINAARNIKVLNGEIGLAGFNGIHIENDVKDIEVTGNYIVDTLASGIVVGHPQHIYENDQAIKHESSVSISGTPIRSWAGVDKEKFAAGTEAVPENIYITNNFLYRTCYGFPGANALASFYTTNMQVLHNYIYDTTYGAMSIGWGWDEYDGFGFTAQGTNKTGGPYHGTHETSIARSPDITTTSRNNKINYNRIEEICTVVNDSGAIYSLGRQGDPGNLPGGGTWDTVNNLTNDPVTDKNSNWNPDNWTNFTEMNYNFLNPNPTDKPTTSNNWTNGFHPDEGSTFIKMIGNVIQSKLSHAPGQSRLFEFNNWKRKSDMIAVDGYVDGNNNQNGAPRIVNNNFKSEARIWPVKGNEIVLNSGLTNEYTHMIPRSLIADTEFELASNVILGKGEKLNRRGLLKAQDTVWLAPANTTTFSEGNTMTKAAGDANSIKAPNAAGEYKLYIQYGDGKATATSKYTVYVDQSAAAVNVNDGDQYEVSAVRPLELTLGAGYTFKLNGNAVTSGYKIATEGTWNLIGSTTTEPNAINVTFTTTISVANKLLPADVSVAPGGQVRFALDLNDPTKKIWISSSSGGHFDGGDDETVTSGDKVGMTAPALPGPYIIYVLAEDGEVLSQSHARVVVTDTTLADIPREGLDLWLKADEGVERDGSGNVTGWTNMGSVPAKLVPANVPGSGGDNLGTPTGNPTIKKDVYDYVDFAANARPLKAAGFKNYNGSTKMTIYTLVKPTTTANNSSDQSGLVYFGLNEAYQTWAANDGWSGINLGVGTNRVNLRFGNADGSVSGGGQSIATSATNDLVSVRAQLDGTNRAVYVNNNSIGTGTNAKALTGNRSDLGVGYTMAAATPYRFMGRVLQVLIYDRVLTAEEVAKIETYFSEVKAGRGGAANPSVPASVDKTLLTALIGTVDNLDQTKYTADSWNVFANALTTAQAAVSNGAIGQDAADDAYYALRGAIKSLQLYTELVVTGEGGATSITTKNGTLQMSAGVPAVWSVTAEDGSETQAAIISETGLLTAKKNGVVKVTAKASDSGLSGFALITISGQEGALLSGPSSVLSGEPFKLNFGLNNLTSEVYAIDLTVRYDADKVEYVSGVSLVDGFSIVLDQEGTSGGEAKIRFLAAGSGQAISNTDKLLELSFKAKTVATAVEANAIKVENVVISDGVTETPVSAASHNVAIALNDKAALSAAISAADNLLTGAMEGTFLGQYAPGSKALLQAKLTAARDALADPDLSQAGIQEAVTALTDATSAFSGSLKTLAGASTVTIGDLAVIGKYYGQSSADVNWTLYKALGITTPRPIGIQDLAAVAQRIMSN